MSIPFLSVQPQSIKLKVIPAFPARLIGGTAIKTTKAGGDYTVDFDMSELQEVTTPNANHYLVLWDSVTGQYARIKRSNL